MKNFTLITLLFIGLTSYGQRTGEVVFYSNSGDQFFVILNGIQQNAKAETNVKVQGLIDPWYGCKIVSKDNIFTLEKNIMVKQDTLVTYRIIEKKGDYKLRYFSETSLATAPAEPTQNVIVYHATQLPEDQLMQVQGTTTVTTTTTITESNSSDNINMNAGSGEESININMSVSEDGMSVNMTASGSGLEEVDGSQNGAVTTTYSETTTTTTTSGGTTSTSVQATEVTGNQMTTTVGSTCLVDASDMTVIVDMVEDESFADDKMRVAKQYAKQKCLTVSQVKEIAVLFTFSDDQLNFIKYAYTNCVNKSDYYQLMNVFTFSGDKEALEKFLDEQ